MTPNFTYSLALTVTGFICASLVVLIWRMRQSPGTVPLLGLLGFLTVWELSYALYWAVRPSGLANFCFDLANASVAFTAACIPLFVIHLVQHKWRRSRSLGLLLAIEPLVVAASIFHSPWKHLYYGPELDYAVGVVKAGGPTFWLDVAYSNFIILLAVVLLLRTFLRSTGLYRKQLGIALIAFAVPWLVNSVFVLDISPFPDIDNTPLAFSVAALLFAYAISRHRLLDVVPIARDVLIESMSDGVIVLDVQNRVVDLNPAARRLLAITGTKHIGQPVEQILSDWDSIEQMLQNVIEAHTELLIGVAPRQYHLDARVSLLRDGRGVHRGHLIVLRDITNLKRAQFELERLATTDALTHSLNRRHFLDVAGREVRRAQRFGSPLAMMFLDIDHFKRVNDQYGHAVGDEVLVAFAQSCRACIRDIDLFARFGGEEFVILLPETGLEEATAVAERIRQAVANLIVQAQGHEISFTASFGVTQLQNPQDTLTQMLNRADDALYTAKETGRNRVVVWQEMTEAEAELEASSPWLKPTRRA